MDGPDRRAFTGDRRHLYHRHWLSVACARPRVSRDAGGVEHYRDRSTRGLRRTAAEHSMTWRLTHSKVPAGVIELETALARRSPSGLASLINIGVYATPISLPCRDHPVRRPCLSMVEVAGCLRITAHSQGPSAPASAQTSRRDSCPGAPSSVEAAS